MKSRKKVSRKKAAPHKTRSRRSRVRTNRRTKRGGMIRSVRAVAGTLLYHDILPLLSRASVNIHFGREPTPDEHAITTKNERFYKTILDFPVDNGIKNSIEELRKDLEHPVKTADKMKSIKEKYDAIIKKLDEEKKKQHAKQARELMVVGKPFTPQNQGGLLSSVVNVGPGAASGDDSPIASIINPPFYSPNLKRYPHYSTQRETSTNPLSKSDIRPSDDNKLQITGTPLRPFNPDVSIISPYSQPPPSVRQKNLKSLLISPSRGPSKQLNFNEDNEDNEEEEEEEDDGAL